MWVRGWERREHAPLDYDHGCSLLAIVRARILEHHVQSKSTERPDDFS